MLIDYIREQTGGNFEEYIVNFVDNSVIAEIINARAHMSKEEVALLCISADLTHLQFDTLCKKGVLKDASRLSSRDVKNKYEFPSFGNHLQKEAVTAASAARWEALVVCIRV